MTVSSTLLLDELFETGSRKFFTLLLESRADGKLASFAERLIEDRRPWARKVLLDYIDDGCDRPGHRGLVKRLFKRAERDEDDELMAHFLVAFDRFIEHRVVARRRWDWRTRQHRIFHVKLRERRYPGRIGRGGGSWPHFSKATAERRRRRAEEIAERRRSDIVFLGRGVSARLHDRRCNVEMLEAAGLPVLATPADVATALGISVPRLRWLCFHSEAARVTHYVQFEVPKRRGGVRVLAAPKSSIRSAQRWILDEILSKIELHDAAHGFVRGRSTVTNAREHQGRRMVVTVDLVDFFPSITVHRVRGVFESLGYSPAAATALALLCTESPRRPATYAGTTYLVAVGERALPQGACTSPALSNLVARRLDRRLCGLSRSIGLAYSRYADDLTFSGGRAEDVNVGRLLATVRHVIEDEGFRVNEAKVRVQRAGGRRSVTGVIVNRADRLSVPRAEVRRLRAILHNAGRTGLAAQNRDGRPDFEAHLRGKIAYVAMIDPDAARPLLASFERVTTK